MIILYDSPDCTVTYENIRFYFLVFFCFTLFSCRSREVEKALVFERTLK